MGGPDVSYPAAMVAPRGVREQSGAHSSTALAASNIWERTRTCISRSPLVIPSGSAVLPTCSTPESGRSPLMIASILENSRHAISRTAETPLKVSPFTF